MALDRDLAVAVLRAVARPPADGWEMTAATGVRGLRLLREGPSFRSFVFTEATPRAYDVLRENVGADPRATALLGPADELPARAPFDYVDLDPYGSPLGLLATAVRATRTGGILGVTATDMTVLAGAQPAACRRRYGAVPVRGRLGPEGAVRILLRAVAKEAEAQGRAVAALLGYVGGHHVRAYVELRPASDGAMPVSVLDPDHWTGPPLGSPVPVGPLWTGALVDPALARGLSVPPTAERPRELGRLLELLREDAQLPVPFYYEANSLAARLGLGSPPPLGALLGALREAGYRAGRTHVRPEGFRTDAPCPRVEDVARSLVGRA